MKESGITYHFSSIAQLMKHAGHPPPLHPLIALIDYSKTHFRVLNKGEKITLDFYKSAKEKDIISHLLDAIQSELETNIDAFSQDVLVSQLLIREQVCKVKRDRMYIRRAW